MNGFIEINGKWYKPHPIVMLPTEKARNNHQIVLNQSNQMAWTKPYEFEHLTLMTNEGAMGDGIGIRRFELYWLSDEEAKHNEWCLDLLSNELFLMGPNPEVPNRFTKDYYKKIIASSNLELITGYKSEKTGFQFCADSTLPNNPNDTFSPIQLPRSSTPFLEAFAREYNKGNKIENSLVEYDIFDEPNFIPDLSKRLTPKILYKLKVAPDNTITCKSIL